MVYCYSFLIQENFLFPGHNCGKIAVSNNYTVKERDFMEFTTTGNSSNPAILFFHVMGVTGNSSIPVANYYHVKSRKT